MLKRNSERLMKVSKNYKITHEWYVNEILKTTSERIRSYLQECAQKKRKFSPVYYQLIMEEEGYLDWTRDIKERLEYLRKEIQAQRISYEELTELQSLSEYIEPGDTLLEEWAGVSEK